MIRNNSQRLHNKLVIKFKMQQINDVLKYLKNDTFRKRIEKECEMLLKQYSDVNITFNNDDKLDAIIHVKDRPKNRAYTFILENRYFPFRTPQTLLNNKPFIEFLNTNSDYERNLLKQLYGIECFCCQSLNCPINWAPSITLNRIIDEIDMIFNIRKNILNKIIADKIKAKYLIEDIDLNSWLF